MTLDNHVSYLFDLLELIVDSDTHTVVAIVVITGIIDAVMTLECSQDFGGRYAEGSHTLREELDIDALLTLAIYGNTTHIGDVGKFALHEAGIVGEFLLIDAVAGEGIEHTIHQTEVILHLDGSAGGESGFDIADLTAEFIPTLFDLIVGSGAFHFDLYYSQVII